ncbi:MAG: hypothetical protein CL504_09540 [Actinobacteria bacterium]|nr:hypothetical protein [Actinomycetota bacterium]
MSAKTEKDELFEKTKTEFDVRLDRRLKLSELKDQVERLKQNKNNPAPAPKIKKPKTVKNIFTGNSFPYTDAFEGLPDLEVTEWEEEDGDN